MSHGAFAGLIIGVRVVHELSVKACNAAREFSRLETPIVVVFNGLEPVPLSDGITVVHEPTPLGTEMGLWRWAFAYAVAQGWQWCGVWHDDFLLQESGWEEQLEAGARHRIAIAGLDTRRRIDRAGGSPSIGPAGGEVAVFADGCSIVLNMAIFGLRGMFTDMTDEHGGGDLEAACWALSHGYGVWPIVSRCHHHPSNVRNTRDRHPFGYNTEPAAEKWAHLLPVEATGQYMIKRNMMFSIKGGPDE